jgi:hypothetical protein
LGIGNPPMVILREEIERELAVGVPPSPVVDIQSDAKSSALPQRSKGTVKKK